MLGRFILFFLGIGALIASRPSYHFIKREYNEHQAAQRWNQWRKAQQPSQPGDPVAWLKAEGSDLNTLVLLGANAGNLSLFPSLLEGKAPQEGGLKVILGHRDHHFRRLQELRVGNILQLQAVFSSKRYKVNDIEILTPEKTEARLEEEKKENRLALVTCYPFQYTGSAPLRYVVWAAPL